MHTVNISNQELKVLKLYHASDSVTFEKKTNSKESAGKFAEEVANPTVIKSFGVIRFISKNGKIKAVGTTSEGEE